MKHCNNPVVTIKDQYTGEVVFEGLLTSYTYSTSKAWGTKVSFEARDIVRVNTSAGPITITPYDGPGPHISVLENNKKECDHDWAHYQGLIENYYYCKVCGYKK